MEHDIDAKQLYSLAESTFSKRITLHNLWQEISENFYVERADFTYQRSIGMERAINLLTSYPLQVRRNLGDSLSTMLRPTAKDWFHVGVQDLRIDKDIESRRWLEWSTQTQRRAMYDRASLFNRATKEADHDYAAFGNCVLSIQMNKARDGLLYRCWHLRDVAWLEDAEGKVGPIFRKWKPEARILNQLFRGKVHKNVVKMAEKTPTETVECMHMIVEAEQYDGDARGKPFWSIYYDGSNRVIIEAVPVNDSEYVVPRWQTVSGNQYAFSPAAICALPDARLLQAMMHTLLEAGEKLVNPPMIATQNVVRSDVAVYAGGITWVDEEYDERLGEALRPMTLDHRGMPMGIEMYTEGQKLLSQAFFLDRLTLPERAPEMTAYEVGQRVQEYIRGALPLFEPMEQDYNAQVCEATFSLMLRNGGFGSPHDMPRRLRGAPIQFHFESPLHDAIEQQKGQKFTEVEALIQQAAQLDPHIGTIIDVQTTMRDVLEGIGAPATWIRSDAEAAELADQQKMQAAMNPQSIAQTSQTLQNVQKGAQAAVDLQGLAGQLGGQGGAAQAA